MLSGKTVLITGPARGIGAETARQLAARGAHLALVGLEPDRLSALAAELGPAHVWSECDVTDQAAVDAAVRSVVAALGGLDVVVANAGIASFGTVAGTPIDAIARVIDVNITGVIRTVAATLAHVIERRGYYLLVASAASFAAMPGLAAYAASKSAVEHFAHAFRLEVAHVGVDVGTVHPCWIDTDLVRDARAEVAAFNRLLKRLPGPLGRVTSVDACASAIVGAIERRKRRVFVPGTLAPLAALRHFLHAPPLSLAMAREAARFIPELEREVAAVGRTFGEHSVERLRGNKAIKTL